MYKMFTEQLTIPKLETAQRPPANGIDKEVAMFSGDGMLADEKNKRARSTHNNTNELDTCTIEGKEPGATTAHSL